MTGGWVFVTLLLVWLCLVLLTVRVLQLGARLDRQAIRGHVDRYGSPPGRDLTDEGQP